MVVVAAGAVEGGGAVEGSGLDSNKPEASARSAASTASNNEAS